MIAHRFWIVHILSICISMMCFSGTVWAQPHMGLVGPGVGWALLNQGTQPNPNHHLFWTSDDGGTWTDVTPHAPASRQIAGVFFLDASRGWVLFALTGKELIGASNVSGFDLATTSDGGTNWTFTHVTTPREDHGWAGAGEVFFVDSSHGWLNLELALHDWAVGTLLATTDGGETWNQVHGFNVDSGYGPIRFTDQQNGWVAGGPYGQQHLYATDDGGRTWHKVILPLPPDISGQVISISQCAPPLFKDGKRGFVPATYAGTDSSGNDFKAVALFSTNDRGGTWHLESWVNLGEDRGYLAFTVVDSQALAPKLSGPSGLALMKLGLAGNTTQTPANGLIEVPNSTVVSSLDFSDTSHGWASSSDGRLLSTTDGGAAWKEITPGRKKMSMQPPSSPSLVPSAATEPIAATSSGVTTYTSRHVGFDACTKPTTTQMGTWWTSSPYFDYGVYVGGVNTHCVSLTSSWVKTVTGQGWGLIPIWVGPQAPCTCAPNGGTWPNCTKTWTTISTTGGAYAQGQAEADAATGSKGAMTGFGLGPGSPVYFDMENYSPAATCNGNPTGSYVNSFLSGWVSEIQKNGYLAGVYGNAIPASTWYAGGTGYGAVSPEPADLWLAAYDSRVTIWGFNNLTDAAWHRDQRMHQYASDPSNQVTTWGSLGLNIDHKIENADVTGGNGTKSYSFTYSTLESPPGAAANNNNPSGINNWGQIVGYYLDSTTRNWLGYIYNAGTYSIIDFPNAAATSAYGISNSGNVAGWYLDQNGHYHGFLYQNGSYTSLDFPGATTTYAFGINDDNQVSGYYTDSTGGLHGFQYQPDGSFIPFDYPGASGTTYAYWINGDAQIAGYTTNGVAFLYAGGTFSSPPVSSPAGINNNEQLSGSLGSTRVFEHEGSYVTISFPGASATYPASLNDFIIQNSQGIAKVALVGSYTDANGQGIGFLATSQ